MAIACITGASSGIGKEFAIYLSKMGYKLILISRNTSALKELADTLDTKCKIISCDLSNESSCVRLARYLRHFNINILINNAGFGELGAIDETKLKKDLNMINVNVKAVHILTKALLPGFKKRNQGYILNVASSAGLMPGGPYMSTYYATKAYVTSFTSSLAQELKDAHSKVSVSCLCPGPVDTNFNEVANVEFALKGITPAYCAYIGLYYMFKRKLIIIPTLKMKAAYYSTRFVPRTLTLKVVAHQQKKKYANK